MAAAASAECLDGEVSCYDGECIDETFVCDGGEPDCAGGEDEDPELCGGETDSEICNSGVTASGQADLDYCLGAYCCDEFNFCTNNADPDGITECQDCFENGGGEICDDAIFCGFYFCDAG